MKVLQVLCQNIRRKYEYFDKHCIFWSKRGCFTASFDILNTKWLISPEQEGFRGSNFDSFILGLYMFYWQCKLIYLKFGQKVVMCL